MLLKTVHIDNDIHQDGNLVETLSLQPFIKYLEKKVNQPGMLVPKLAYELVQRKFKDFGDITAENLSSYVDVFELMYHLAKGIPADQEVKWGLGFPVSDRVFYGTESFFNLVETDFYKISPHNAKGLWDFDFINKQLFLLVLERFFDITPIRRNTRFFKKINEFRHYYELELDFTFVEIKVNGEMPLIDLTSLNNKETVEYEDIIPILERFDLSKFTFSGFTICTIRDFQNEYITENLQDLINNISIYKGHDGLAKLNEILAGILTKNGVKTSFYPILKLNDTPILSPELGKNSVILRDDLFYEHYYNKGALYQYLENPTILAFGVEEGIDSENSKLKDVLKNSGIVSYACFPLVSNHNLVGLFEVYSNEGTVLTRNMLIQVQSFHDLMKQLANEIVLSFRNELNNIILHRYTALQPAVAWKFNQVAAQYLGDVLNHTQEVEQEKIIFKQVYPFYAAIDVKDSSLLRNESNRNDLKIRLEFVEKLIHALKIEERFEIDNEFLIRFEEVKKWVQGANLDHYMLDILAFFQEDINQFIKKLGERIPDSIPYLNDFRSKLKYSYEDFFSSSELFEKSLQAVNQTIKSELQDFNSKVQSIYPSYFESFRTDGIEYDLYMGQSISPMVPFKPKLLKEIRKQQIINIALIGKKTHFLKDRLSLPLETTQLIFIHPTPIDISFREDERRFDVEGSYNIRYQIIKKRIDKAYINNSSERLVQPGTIAIVYSRHQVAGELKACLAEVAEMGFISSFIEEFDLENLQGISDLKAMRVKINLENHN
ncbi:hypothetical protein [Sphingobacterium daejeonense]|uniref:hypothetical protein n=1 Tax=Sphingobacterium daejeonense TaxID=371142 RepID=UPI003D31A58E